MMRRVRNRLTVSEGGFGRVLIGFMTIGFVALIAAAVAIAWINGRNHIYTQGVIHTQDVRQAVAAVQVSLEQSETARRGLLLHATPIFLEAYQRTSREIAPGIAGIRELTIDNPAQTARIDRIAPLLTRLQAIRERAITQVASDRAAAQAAFLSDGSVPLTRAIRYRLQAMAQEETRLLAYRTALQRQTTIWFYIASIVAGVLLALVALISLLVVLYSTRALTASRDSLRDLNETLEDQVATRTADLSRANEEIQRFAYIVSHDLRSPLVNVMGFTAELESATRSIAELVTRAEADAPTIVSEEARLAAREDLPEAIGFIRTSTQKMDRLINAILKLSREGRRVIAPEALDLVALVEGIAGSIQHIVDQNGITLTIDRPLPALTSDRVAVEQILSNLIENATKYLQPGRAGEIVVSGVERRGRVILSVADNGRGIDPRDHARVFDLFRRSGQQDQPGEGIGLAHVRALAYRLGGTIDVDSELGTGSTFSINLPKTFVSQETRP